MFREMIIIVNFDNGTSKSFFIDNLPFFDYELCRIEEFVNKYLDIKDFGDITTILIFTHDTVRYINWRDKTK